MTSRPSPWAILLAGGDGRRLESVTLEAAGEPVPKQFFPIGRDRASLLARTRRRARQLADPDRVVVVVQESHRRYWSRELADLPPQNVVVQPGNRGTSVALLHTMNRILARDRDPRFVVLPTDHEVHDRAAWNDSVRRALVAAGTGQQPIVVGVEPQSDPDFGWILPGASAPDRTHTVVAFVEKPGRKEAENLARRGALCNSFVVASSATALLALYQKHAPDLLTQYARALAAAERAPGGLPDSFAALPFHDFCRDILVHAAADLRVSRASACGWTDLGTPARLQRWIEREEEPLRHRHPACGGAATTTSMAA